MMTEGLGFSVPDNAFLARGTSARDNPWLNLRPKESKGVATRRTIRVIKLVVETEGLTQTEHDKRVVWAETNASNANQYMREAFVSTVVFDADGKNVIRFQGNGLKASKETEEIISDLVEGSDE